VDNNIRPLAICIFIHQGRLLVAEGYDPTKKETFYRPLGGGIIFGETGLDTIKREIREEIGAEITDLQYLTTMENIFTFNGKRGHEIVLVFLGRFVETKYYQQPHITGIEDSGIEFRAKWKRLDSFKAKNAPPLYPEGLLQLLIDRGFDVSSSENTLWDR
jgi:ADP-ribose pyrophosphatase YjhB (NUDIX family)